MGWKGNGVLGGKLWGISEGFGGRRVGHEPEVIPQTVAD